MFGGWFYGIDLVGAGGPTRAYRKSVMTAYVYIMTNRPHRVLTTDIARRAWEHRDGVVEGFTSRYGLKRLVFVEVHGAVADAIRRERTLKTWRRAWKVRLIEAANAGWDDLYATLALGVPG